MHDAIILLTEFIKQHILLICIAIAAILAVSIVLLLIQWKRVSYRKKHPKTVDRTADAKQAIEYARQLIETGLLKGIRAEIGDTVPQDTSILQKCISDAYGLRAGGLYISVDSISVFTQQASYVFLQGSDDVGGEAVLPLKVSESGERFFYLEGLSICYHRDGFRYTVRYNIRFSLEKSLRPIEEVLEFEVA